MRVTASWEYCARSEQEAGKFNRSCKRLTSKHKYEIAKANHDEHQHECEGVPFILFTASGSGQDGHGYLHL
jgi:hypothetical protein